MDEVKQYETICKPEFKEIKTDVKEILSLLQGNGVPGVFTRLALLEQDNKTSKESGGSTRNWILGIVAAIIVLVAQTMFIDWLATRQHIGQDTKQVSP
jgi:hypothetical protein